MPGSPVPTSPQAAPAGWYPDPADQTRERYWDGGQWTQHIRPVPPVVPTQIVPPVVPTQPTGPVSQPYAGPGVPGFEGQGAPQGWSGYPPEVATTADGVRLGGWWMRLLAYIVDALLLGIATSIVTTPMLAPYSDAVTQWSEDFARQITESGQVPDFQDILGSVPSVAGVLGVGTLVLITLVQVGIWFAYFLLLTRYGGRTLGKMICGLKVVPVDRGRDTARLDWGPAAIRAAVWTLPMIGNVTIALSWLGLLRLVDGLWPLGNRKRQALHDLAAGTQVIRTR